MTYNPATKLRIQVEAYIDGAWLVITSRARKAGGLRITHGRSDGAIQAETSTCELTLGNDDSWLTEGNPVSPWFEKFGRGTAIRIALIGILASPAYRFTGEIEDMNAEYPARGKSVMRVTATGTLGVAAQNDDPLGSALYRSMIGVAEGDYVPHAYWPLEDEAGATVFASGVAGQPSTPVNFAGGTEPPEPATSTVFPGSLPVVSLPGGTGLAFTIPDYTDTGVWAIQMALDLSTTDTTCNVTIRFTNGNRMSVTLLPYVPIMSVFADTQSGTSLFTNSDSIDTDIRGIPASLLIGGVDTGPGDQVVVRLMDSEGTTLAQTTDINPGAYGLPQTATISSPAGSGDRSLGVGHLTVFTDAAFNIATDGLEGALAMGGWTGEQAHERAERLGREEGLAVTVVGTSSAPMGVQLPGTLFGLWLECERADQALISDQLDDLGIVFRTRESLYNQTAQVAISKGSLTPDFAPVWDNQRTTNDVTLSRVGGSSARVSDEDHVTRTRRRLRTTPQASLATDDVLAVHAGWRLALGTTPGPRYAEGGINMRNGDGALLADAVLGLVPGDRMTAEANVMPEQHPPHGFDQMVLGWSEDLDAYEWQLSPVLVPYSPYKIAVYGSSATSSRYGSAHSTLASSATATATTLSIATEAGHALWRTGSTPSSPFPLYWDISGIRIKVTAISGGTSPQTATVERSVDGYDKALSSGAQVRMWDPARYGL